MNQPMASEYRRTSVDAIRDLVVAMARGLAGLDWLTTGAFLLTIGSFLGAVLDSYTSLCTVGAALARIGSVTDCPSVGGWDTRTFPLAVDMGWAGALLSTVRLAHVLGLSNWRWWAVLFFEILTAGATVAGNALHVLIAYGYVHAEAHPTLHFFLLAMAASSVPGVVAVGAGFTLNVNFSTRHARPRPPRQQTGRGPRLGLLGFARSLLLGDTRPPSAPPSSARPPAITPSASAQALNEPVGEEAAREGELVAIGRSDQLERSIAYVRSCWAERYRPVGPELEKVLGLSAPSARRWLGRALQVLAEEGHHGPDGLRPRPLADRLYLIEGER